MGFFKIPGAWISPNYLKIDKISLIGYKLEILSHLEMRNRYRIRGDGFLSGSGDCVTIRHPDQAPWNGASRDLEVFVMITFSWIPDLAMLRAARPE